MHPNPVGDVSEGMDMSFDEGDTCRGRRNGPWVGGPRLGGMPAVSDGLVVIGTVSGVCAKARAHPLACETHPLGAGTCHRAGDSLGDVPAVWDVLDVVLPGVRRSWGHARGCGQALVHAGRMWGSRGCAPGQGRPHVPARVLGHRLTRVHRMSNASGTRLDVQRIVAA